MVSSPDGGEVKIAADCGITAESESKNLLIVLRALGTLSKYETESNICCFLKIIAPPGDLGLATDWNLFFCLFPTSCYEQRSDLRHVALVFERKPFILADIPESTEGFSKL